MPPKKHKPTRQRTTAAKQKRAAQNPKAFGFNSKVKAMRRQQRTEEKDQSKLHVPLADRSQEADEEPPVLVMVCGPPGVGKSSLIRSLVKHYTKQNLNEVRGPVTVVTGKRRRLTFFECGNDLNMVCDLSKICDLALMVVDGSFGFEMETFEALNVLQMHGMPRVMGVLTHLDEAGTPKQVRAVKKALKNRFWTDIYEGAKLFYFSGMLHGRYPKNEVQNLSRFISVLKFRPLIWRNTHSSMLADRLEDITPSALLHTADGSTSTVNRTVSLYGYVRGCTMRQNARVHIPGEWKSRELWHAHSCTLS
jgi:ribosome biogenesis protein BMS1